MGCPVAEPVRSILVSKPAKPQTSLLTRLKPPLQQLVEVLLPPHRQALLLPLPEPRQLLPPSLLHHMSMTWLDRVSLTNRSARAQGISQGRSSREALSMPPSVANGLKRMYITFTLPWHVTTTIIVTLTPVCRRCILGTLSFSFSCSLFRRVICVGR